ncbi:MAG: phosphatidate cytidylyltransferase [Candidatus Lightella neohaematopini]|nr:phosphatidate cytidylyltransferase [Candidatus Lightella neohaematopini]
MLIKRIFTAIIIIFAINLLIFKSPKYIFILALFIICTISSWEWGKISNLSSIFYKTLLLIINNIILSILIFLITNIKLIYRKILLLFLTFIPIIWWLIAIYLLINYNKLIKIWYRLKIIKLLFSTFIIVPLLYSITIIYLYYYNIGLFQNALLLYLIIIISCIDSISFVYGSYFGYKRIMLTISPNKTWEGFMVGLLSSTVISFILISIMFNNNKLLLVISSIISLLLSIIGDLTESMFKRLANLKDSSSILPGHGGILDRIDSFSISVPIFTFLLILFS